MRTLLPPRAVAAASALLLALAAAPAHAKDVHPDDPGNQMKQKKEIAEKGGKKGKKGKGKKGDNGVGPFKKKDYPVAERLRPLVLPNGMGEAGLDLGISSVKDVIGNGSTTYLSAGLNFDYGVGDVGEIGASAGLLLSPDFDFSSLTLRGHYLAYDTKELDFAPGLLVPIAFYDNAPFGVVVDLPARYVLDNGLFLRFGQGAIPIGLSPDFSLAISANGGVGYQITAPFLVYADTSVLTLLLAPDTAFTGLWEVLVLDIGGQYSPTKDWDVGAQLNLTNVWDVEKSFGWSLGLFGRYRF